MILGPAFDLIRELAALGIELRVDGADLVARPKALVSAELARRIVQVKPALIVLLNEPQRVTVQAHRLLERSIPIEWTTSAGGRERGS